MKNYTPENLKKKAAIIREFLKEKYDVNISQGHSLELTSKIIGFKDWNTAVAHLKRKAEQNSSLDQIQTVGDMKRVLESFDDSDTIDADYEFKLNEFEIDPLSNPEDEVYQEFSISSVDSTEGIVIFKLQLEHESIASSY